MTGDGDTAYVGRFAPSPTGRLHLGSLLAAIGSFLDARASGGRWLLRLDDLDTPRNEPGAAEAIITELRRLGFEWDGEVHHQSLTAARYRVALDALTRAGHTFACGCSRRVLVDGVYPGHCRDGLAPGMTARALRLRVTNEPVIVEDIIQGHYQQILAQECGDFVVLRADDVVAYHLATVVDDAAAGVTDIWRGADLLASTPRQVVLQRALGLPTPRYAHLPMVVSAGAIKLSKQNQAPSTHTEAPAALWRTCLALLGQRESLARNPPRLAQLISTAIEHWRPDAIPTGPIQAG